MQNSMLKTVLFAMSLFSAAAFAPGARAEIPSGFFEGKIQKSGQSVGIAQVFIRTVQVKGIPVSYGLLIKADPDAAIFRIEELEDGTQVWIRLSQTGASLIGSSLLQEADLTVQRVGGSLVMRPTETSQCQEQFTEIEVNPQRGLEWATLHDGRVEERHFFGEDFGVDLSFRDGVGVLSGKFKLVNQTVNGSFRLSEVIPGVAAMRAQVLNPESPDGRALSREITALVAMLKQSRGGEGLRFIKVSGLNGCLDPMSRLGN